jgi:hypothetical protein
MTAVTGWVVTARSKSLGGSGHSLADGPGPSDRGPGNGGWVTGTVVGNLKPGHTAGKH